MMLKRFAYILSLSLIFVTSACQLTLPVKGQLTNGKEKFTGLATGQLDGSGTLEISSNKGTDCQGNFVYTSSRTGEGTFVCSDGRSGPFSFVSTGSKGTGTGSIGGDAFTFVFGE